MSHEVLFKKMIGKVVVKARGGLFHVQEQEERKISNSAYPAVRVTELLKPVFGGLE